jgi:hypothetical protein
MDILIKSFNRPYYLARCIQSIYDNVLDEALSITVLDDGTPKKYLQKIKFKYPDVKILLSDFYQVKSESIGKENYTEISGIPIDFWLDAARNASDYFLLLEDDIWFTQKINLRETNEIMIQDNIYFLKLFWLNNQKLIYGKTKKVKNQMLVYEPSVFAKNPLLHRLIFGITRFGNRKMMQLLNLYSEDRALNYYSIYGVAGAIFKKEYFLNLWHDHKNLVDENLQIINAVKFWSQNPEMQFARTTSEYLATGFSSSATNKFFNPNQFDVFAFNKLLNDAWLADEIDVFDNLPDDLNDLKVKEILLKSKHKNVKMEDWVKWVDIFKKQFQDIGCKI